MYKDITFENEETEQYFYEVVEKYGIRHVSFADNTVITKETIDNLVQVVLNIQNRKKERMAINNGK